MPGEYFAGEDDIAYLRWIAAHPSGYVVNAYKIDPVLHSANCPKVGANGAKPDNGGASWTNYPKQCLPDREAVNEWDRTRSTGGKLWATCPICKAA